MCSVRLGYVRLTRANIFWVANGSRIFLVHILGGMKKTKSDGHVPKPKQSVFRFWIWPFLAILAHFGFWPKNFGSRIFFGTFRCTFLGS